MNIPSPAVEPELGAVLLELVTSVQATLGDNFVGAYLQGSLALGDFDGDSDVDFLIVTEDEVSEAHSSALQAMHAGIYDLDSPWAKHLEGSYIPKGVLRRHEPAGAPLLYLDNGSRRLVWSTHDNTLVVRWVVRERGITLVGPEPKSLIDLVAADDLRREVSATMREWAAQLFAEPNQMNNRWYQPFAVLTFCRMLYTLQMGSVASKLAAAQWAQAALDSRWRGLIQRAWSERPNPSLKIRQPADPDDFNDTLDFINYVLGQSRHHEDGTP